LFSGTLEPGTEPRWLVIFGILWEDKKNRCRKDDPENALPTFKQPTATNEMTFAAGNVRVEAFNRNLEKEGLQPAGEGRSTQVRLRKGSWEETGEERRFLQHPGQEGTSTQGTGSITYTPAHEKKNEPRGRP